MIKIILAVEVIAFLAAASVHFGFFIHGYEHPKAPIAESIIAFVLLIGLIITFVKPSLMRKAGLAVQGFALLVTLIGLFTIIIGVGPQSLPDLIFHICIIFLLTCGFFFIKRTTG
jgi:hypothetical protein